MEPTIGKIDWAVFRDTTQELLDQTIYQPFAKKSTAAPIISDQLRAEIRQIVREELDKRALGTLKVTYPPEFVKGLEEVFRALQCDSRELKTAPHSPAVSPPNS